MFRMHALTICFVTIRILKMSQNNINILNALIFQNITFVKKKYRTVLYIVKYLPPILANFLTASYENQIELYTEDYYYT